MISDYAVAKIDELTAAGLHPTTEDIIRLNALGLRLEAAQKKFASDSLPYLPRVAQISAGVFFRQPTVGHEIWLTKTAAIFSPDFDTRLALKAYALSRPPSDLPDPESPSAVKIALDDYAEEMRDFTREQIAAALDYVEYGASSTVGELAETDPSAPPRKPDGSRDEDWTYCVAAGVLHRAAACLTGLTVADMQRMTVRQLQDATDLAGIYHKIEPPDMEREAQVDFLNTYYTIKERLEKEKENM